ncbi:MAG: phosphatidate cytidylyltransferase [Planctomycetaceae bacterium]|nr:phosphatidate cytidylyltransferase [Planctomycetales bacterium]MCB9874475.1 phosphatidate cytidylyltransferase [Planctomycetaceae bacterium]HRX78075.1 phosphatidate cytidylyltransferase [Pirellulaceae bacterium]
MNDLANRIGVQPNLVLAVGAMLGSLLLGSILRAIWLKLFPTDHNHDRWASLKTWWVLVLLFCGAILLGHVAVAVIFAIASGLGLREYMRLTHSPGKGPPASRWVYGVVPVQYLWVGLGQLELFWITVPVACLLVIAGSNATAGKTKGFLRAVATDTWGLLLLVFCLSHVAMFLALPDTSNSVAGNAGWVFYLVLLTESNDIAQALWGRQFGRHKVTPVVSPHKTWEGLLLGIGTTVIVAIVLAPLLTPLHAGPTRSFAPVDLRIPYLWSAVAGALIAISGFFGDITMSAVKRDIGVKDSSSLLPGQGGMLDRIDSLTFTAPAMFYFVYWLYPF